MCGQQCKSSSASCREVTRMRRIYDYRDIPTSRPVPTAFCENLQACADLVQSCFSL